MGLREQHGMICRKQKPADVSDGCMVKKPPVYCQSLSHRAQQPVVGGQQHQLQEKSREDLNHILFFKMLFTSSSFFCFCFLLMSQIKSGNVLLMSLFMLSLNVSVLSFGQM